MHRVCGERSENMIEQFSISGLDELVEDLEKAVKLYPDKSMETLEQAGKKFKNRVIKITNKATFKHTGKLVKGYKLDPVEGFGINMQINFRGTAPHFHLIENGHDLVSQKTRNGKKLEDGGKVMGFVPGRLIVHQAREEYKTKLPKEMKKMLEDILKESDL